jgi:hypothetical protein
VWALQVGCLYISSLLEIEQTWHTSTDGSQ